MRLRFFLSCIIVSTWWLCATTDGKETIRDWEAGGAHVPLLVRVKHPTGGAGWTDANAKIAARVGMKTSDLVQVFRQRRSLMKLERP